MRDKGLSGTCRAALFHALLPVVPPLSGSVPEQGDSQEGGGGRIPSAAPFSPAAPRCASSGGSLRSDASSPSLHARRRSVLSPHISRCENLPSAARTNIARGRPVPNTGLDAPAAGLRRPLTAPFRLRKGEPPPGVGTGNRGLSPLSSASFRGGKDAMPSSFGELRAVRKAAGAGAGDAKPALSFFGAGVTTPRRSSAACRCRAVSGRSGRTAPLRCGRSDSASAPCGRIGG